MRALTVACVLRSGGEYKPEHVRALFTGVMAHWPAAVPARFVALTDCVVGMPEVEELPLLHGWPKWWAKLELFRPDLQFNWRLDDLLYFDLDTVIVGDLVDVARVRRLVALADFYRPERMIGSGMMSLPAWARPEVWRRWTAAPQEHMRRFRGDQEFLYDVLGAGAERWQTELPGQVVSYKVHVQKQGRVPEGARVVCFHGRPRPWAVRGRWAP